MLAGGSMHNFALTSARPVATWPAWAGLVASGGMIPFRARTIETCGSAAMQVSWRDDGHIRPGEGFAGQAVETLQPLHDVQQTQVVVALRVTMYD